MGPQADLANGGPLQPDLSKIIFLARDLSSTRSSDLSGRRVYLPWFEETA